MDYETRFPANLIAEADLADLVQRLAKVTNAVAHAETIYVVSTDDADFSSVLDTISDRLIRTAKPFVVEDVKRTGKGGLKRGQKIRRGAGQRPMKAGPNSFTNIKTNEIISARALNVKLAAGEVEDSAVFVKPDGRRFVALDGKLIKEPQA